MPDETAAEVLAAAAPAAGAAAPAAAVAPAAGDALPPPCVNTSRSSS